MLGGWTTGLSGGPPRGCREALLVLLHAEGAGLECPG